MCTKYNSETNMHTKKYFCQVHIDTCIKLNHYILCLQFSYENFLWIMHKNSGDFLQTFNELSIGKAHKIYSIETSFKIEFYEQKYMSINITFSFYACFVLQYKNVKMSSKIF